ncbi:AAA family ATPase [Pseudoalteromonas prydzensis]|uniref:AAA family ATPase n=1 Tax=Pseudoalteromonas prydzensis TaxID=182141 RepID=A0ABR9FLT1_9GAMM|nr:AAA family ATPase [Pseudoalteromonas prydzensis]MBE0457786.1 AAA family ATPase [Pseudoalteromonas prydzensis]
MSITNHERQQFLEQFKKTWPIERLKTLKLEDYTSVGDKETLAYWLEFGIGRYLGSIKGGDSSKFGIYERKAEPKGQRDFISSDDRYSWKNKYGTSAKSAFANIKKKIIAVIDAVQAGDVEKIELLDFESALKWKLAFIYQNHAKPCVLPIYKLSKFKPFMADLPNYTHTIAYTKLLAIRGNRSALEYGFELWQKADAIEGQSTSDFDTPNDEENAISTLKSAPLNQILYGPPGTGKTYETVRAALQVLDPVAVAEYDACCHAKSVWKDRQQARQVLKARFDELKGQQRIRFVTFHQSFSYEDFVEGLRAETDEASGQLRYEVVDGVFKSLCEAADAKVTQKVEATIELNGRTVWKMSLGNTLANDAAIFEDCVTNDYVLLGYGGDIDFAGCKSRQEVQQRFVSSGVRLEDSRDYRLTSVTAFVTKMKPGDLVVVSDGNFKFRAIGEICGDYAYKTNPEYDGDYAQMRPVRWLRQYSPSLPHTELLNGQFSQMTLYKLSSPSLDKAKLAQLLAHAPTDTENQRPGARVLIIDEINRGNISRIFGELITLIEPSKRAGAAESLEVTLPYSKKPFRVPDNVFLIGTMNTADRSLAGLDIALRRRFAFTEMPPRPELLQNVSVERVNIGGLLAVMNQRIAALLDRDHCLGHAYFMPLHDEQTLARLADIFRQNIIPLLQEYFFEDWERIRWVLNDQSKAQEHAFIVAESAGLPELFPKVNDRLRQTQRWQLNDKAFSTIEAYRGIVAVASTPAETAVTSAQGEFSPALTEDDTARMDA